MLLSRRKLTTSFLAMAPIFHPLFRKVKDMSNKAINATGPAFAHAHLVENPSRLLFVSGQIPVDSNDRVPKDFDDQCRLVWRNIETQLTAAGMGLNNIVKVTSFLSDRKYRLANSKIRSETLGNHDPAVTIIICGIYEEEWLLEIEAIAAA
jgi:2-iminobutanoate/2-iminopropanoate deaminase